MVSAATFLRQAVAAGHEVTVVVRDPQRLPDMPVRVVAQDLAAPDPAGLVSSLDGADTALSGLGALSGAQAGSPPGVPGPSSRPRQPPAYGASSWSAPVGTVPSPGRPNPPRRNPGGGFFMRHLAAPLAKAAFRGHYIIDLTLMEDVLRDSDLDWTAIRPPRLLNGRLTRKYRTAYEHNVRGGMFIARADVAYHMLDVINRPETVHRVIGIAY